MGYTTNRYLHSLRRLVRPINLLNMSYAVVSIGYIYIATQSSVSLLFTAAHDDGLFISNAFSIFTTGWLPQYDQLALAKGPGFPLFMAINGILGLPITFSLAATFVGSALALSISLNRAGAPPIGSFLVFGLIVSNFSLIPTRLVRDNLYVSLTLFAVVLCLELFVVDTDKKKSPIVLFLLGILFGAFFLTREEFLWISPSFLFLFLFFLWSNRKIPITFASWGPVAIALFGFIVPVFGVGVSNYFQYGVFQTNDFTQGSFPAAFSKLQEVNSKSDPIPYLPVPKSVREEVYNVSPKFAELKQALESDLLGWQTHSCQRYPETCGDYGGGWFAWAFRDAVAQGGYYSDAISANVFYAELTKEIQEACDREIISCKASRIPLVPIITRDAIERVSNSFVNSLDFALDQNLTFYHPTSVGSPEESAILTEFLGLPDPFTLEGSDTHQDEDRMRSVKQFITDIKSNAVKHLFLLSIISQFFILIAQIRKPYYWLMVRSLSVVYWGVSILIYTRILLIALIDGTSFPAISASYLGPAIALFPIICVIPLINIGKIAIDFLKNQRH